MCNNKILKFSDYKNCLSKNEIILKLKQRYKRETHNVYIKEISKIARSSNDDKRLQTFDRITLYPCRTSVGKVCKAELLSKYKRLILMITQMKLKQNVIYNGHAFLIIQMHY